MPLVRMDELLKHARKRKYAVAAFECWNSANIYAIAAGAAECKIPVIFQASPVEYEIMGGPDALRRIVELYVKKTGITAALHLDHGSTLAHVEECADAGFTSVMLDASTLPFDENTALSEAAADIAHKHGICIEAELGHVGGSDEGGMESRGDNLLTDPLEAVTFIRETGIDCLAVAIGTVHGDYHGKPHIDLDRLRKINEALDMPLVLHGGSGTPPGILRRAIINGIAKINICTDIHKVWLEGISIAKGTLTPSVPGKFYRPPHDMLCRKVKEIIMLFKDASGIENEKLSE